MKKLMLIMLAGAFLTAVGCTERQTVPEQPPAVVQKAPEVSRLPSPVSRVEPEEINSDNLAEIVGQLENDMRRDNRAMTKLDRELPDGK